MSVALSRRETPRPLTTRPLVSVCIPCFNYGQFVAGAVASVLDQPHKAPEKLRK